VQSIYASIRLKSIATLAVCLQTVGVILAFALMAFFTVVAGSVNLPLGAIVLYHMFWLFAVCVVPMFRSFKI
jgi:hypothetical protein